MDLRTGDSSTMGYLEISSYIWEDVPFSRAEYRLQGACLRGWGRLALSNSPNRPPRAPRPGSNKKEKLLG